ncbi:MAG: response regulator transcription factor [Bacteroidales bacterium]|nr:response regulator transcription factor [Bacteroidales bacterium]MCF8327499.1 response regulator transcription factor [Bacteroidales bacterium]
MENKDYKILIVDDEKDILEFLSYNLKKEDYQVKTIDNGTQALEIAKTWSPHLVILDVMMPEFDGIETCREMRTLSNMQQAIILFLTARGEDYSQIAGFEAGADDYVAKPVKPRVLTSRIKALLRRSSTNIEAEEKSQYEVGNLIIDKEKYLVTKNDKQIILPKKEFELLQVLTSKPNKVFTREEIFSKVWGENVIVGDRTIDVHVRKLREKVGDENIKTVKGVGYKFELTS